MNSERNIDLHSHTLHSDGDLHPDELLERAASYGLAALSITDHDTSDAYSTWLFEMAKIRGIELIPGIELSTRDGQGRKYHILGYFLDFSDTMLQKLLSERREVRRQIAETLIHMFLHDGWSVESDVLASVSIRTKVHIARQVLQSDNNKERLVHMFGRIPTEGEFIEQTMLKGRPYFVADKKENQVSPETAIRTIQEANGLAILAHPSFNIIRGDDPQELLERFYAMGIDGFEAIYVQFDRSNGDSPVNHRDILTSFAALHGLLISGGSDFHTDDTEKIGAHIDLGFHNHEWKVPYTVVSEMRKYWLQRVRG